MLPVVQILPHDFAHELADARIAFPIGGSGEAFVFVPGDVYSRASGRCARLFVICDEFIMNAKCRFKRTCFPGTTLRCLSTAVSGTAASGAAGSGTPRQTQITGARRLIGPATGIR